MKSFGRSVILGIALCAAFTVGIAMLARNHQNNTDNRLAVTATFYPMAEFAQQVGGSRVHVTTLVPAGIEPHDYEPTPRDVASIYASKVFIYNGAGLERWVDKISHDLAASGVVSVRASNGIALQAKDPTDINNLSPTDPHVWMDPKLAVKQVENIVWGLSKADPPHAATYQTNANAYIAKLRSLDADFARGLRDCNIHTIVTSHQAFGYLSQAYGIQSIGIAGLNPDDEPSPQKLAEVSNAAKAADVHYIFFETLVSPKLSQTIAKEIGARTIAFNPLEGLTDAQRKAGESYISIQKDNLQALRTALDCR